jgi:hypothetical protein
MIMKILIIQIKVLMMILICGLSIYLIFVFRFNASAIENYKFDKGINKLVAGDSHTLTSINDKLLPNAQNISQTAEGLFFSYYKLRTLLINNSQIETVFLGVSYQSFSSYYNDINRKPDGCFPHYIFILPPPVQIGFLKDTKNTFALIQKSIVAGTDNWVRNIPDYAFMGSFSPVSTKILLSDKTLDKRINLQFFDDGKINDLSEENIYYFKKIVDMCNDMKVRLIILNTPMHPGYKEKVPPKFVNEFNSIVKNGEIELIEFEDLKLSDNDFLPDGDHLQESGSRLATLYLKELLSKPNLH